MFVLKFYMAKLGIVFLAHTLKVFLRKKQGPQGPNKLSPFKLLKIPPPPPLKHGNVPCKNQKQSLSNSRWQNRNERPK